jgi:1,4-dihydroxy-2-naphthoyl-CoA synthase
MSYQTILYEVDASKARITLNRPEKRNATQAIRDGDVITVDGEQGTVRIETE